MPRLRPTVIIPFHRDLRQLAQSLPAARLALPDAEIIVAADGAIEDCRELARASAAKWLSPPLTLSTLCWISAVD